MPVLVDVIDHLAPISSCLMCKHGQHYSLATTKETSLLNRILRATKTFTNTFDTLDVGGIINGFLTH